VRAFLPIHDGAPRDVAHESGGSSRRTKRPLAVGPKWRGHIGITRGELAVRIDVSQAAIAKLEKPNARPHRVTLKKIAEALGNP